MSDQRFVEVQDGDGNVYKLSPAEAAAARASGIYKTPEGKEIPFHREPSLPPTESGKVRVWSKSTGKSFDLFPVDAAEAIKSGEFSKTAPTEEPAEEGEPGEPGADAGAAAPERNPWEDEDGKLTVLPEDAKRDVITEALKSQSVQFRGNASNADLLEQWNEYVAEKAAE